jgi:hypothetical protein
MDPDAEPLEDFLAPVPKYLDPFELSAMRYRWYVSVKLPCNWKVAVEAFNEGYHVAGTHPQLLQGQGDDSSYTETFGRHGRFWNPMPNRPFGAPSARTGLPVPDDLRPGIIGYVDIIDRQLSAIYSRRDARPRRRLMELDPATPHMELMGKLIEFQKEAAIASGAGWPDITPMQMFEAGIDWHIFPNMVILPYADAALCYRALPDPQDPDRCTFEIYSLERYAPGAEPPLERQYFHGPDEWRNFSTVSEILQQDFNNMGEIQKGMKSRGFAGARPNPLQESTVSNFHRAHRGVHGLMAADLPQFQAIALHRDGRVSACDAQPLRNAQRHRHPMQDELLGVVELAAADEQTLVLVLTGAGKAFCAGAMPPPCKRRSTIPSCSSRGREGQEADPCDPRLPQADHRQGQRRGHGPWRNDRLVLRCDDCLPSTRKSPIRT